MIRRLVLLLVATATALSIAPGTASAHNSLDASTPADGAVLDAAPGEIHWFFTNAAPLDTLTVTLVDAAGVRTEIGGSTHGSAGTTEVVTPLPALPAGETTVRWRLVGPDGHPVTGRVTFTISPPATTLPATTAVPATPNPSAATSPSTTPPTSPAPESTVDASATPAASFDDDDATGAPDALRWMLRALSYLSIMIAAGVVITRAFVWRDTGWDRYRPILAGSLAATAVLALLQLLVVASDISGGSMLGSFGEIDAALSTHAGIAFVVRVALALLAWTLVVHAPPAMPDVRASVLVILSLGMLGTWSFAGHSRTMRWPGIGVPIDMIHHGAAAAWLGGLTILGFVALKTVATDDLAPVMHRFSRTAEISVALIVATGLIQGLRLVGNPLEVFADRHGTLLVVKLAVLGLMLWAAHGNRRRVFNVVRSAGAAARPDVDTLRRALVIELVIGLVIIGITAAMVVSPPTAGP